MRTALKLKPAKPAVTGTRIGEIITDALNNVGWSIRDLSREVDTTYEHIRRVAKGEGIPSNPILRDICTALGVNFDEAMKAVTADRIERTFGDIPAEIAGKNPELEGIERAWKHLTEEQKAAATSMIVGWAKINRAAAKG